MVSCTGNRSDEIFVAIPAHASINHAPAYRKLALKPVPPAT